MFTTLKVIEPALLKKRSNELSLLLPEYKGTKNRIYI